jgi:hypothetical protein
MAPGQSGRVELEQSQSQARIASPSKLTSKATVLLAGVGKGKQRESFRFFDLSERICICRWLQPDFLIQGLLPIVRPCALPG